MENSGGSNDTNPKAGAADDVWFGWLLDRRFGGDEEHKQTMLAAVEGYADRVLDGAQLAPGMTLADIGSGYGLIAFKAISRIGSSLRVILTDISPLLLRRAEQHATELGVRDQCVFIKSGADKLTGIADATVDVATTRASLAYVVDKGAALREFRRVLKPGGRISLAEPILQDYAFETVAMGNFLATVPANHPEYQFMRLQHRVKSAQYPSTEREILQTPMTSFSERDLVRFLREAGFVEIHLELHIDVGPTPVATWEGYLKSALHPWAPTVGQIMAERFSPDERTLYEKTMRPLIEARESIDVATIAYVTARKPAHSPRQY
jgi:ubiquinone/menaquinone biosynthesis C-methylase UbiE